MSSEETSRLFTRRRMLQLGLAVPAGLLIACKADEQPGAQTTPTTTSGTTPATDAPATLTQTPACDDGDDATPAQTEGPYFSRTRPSGPRCSLRASPEHGWC